jgi:hypothetical protein
MLCSLPPAAPRTSTPHFKTAHTRKTRHRVPFAHKFSQSTKQFRNSNNKQEQATSNTAREVSGNTRTAIMIFVLSAALIIFLIKKIDFEKCKLKQDVLHEE